MSQGPVKWVNPKDLHDEKPVWDKAELFVIPVVPLSALRDVVEGLKLLSEQQPQRSHPLWGEWVSGPDYRSKSFKMWLAQRLLASLGEVGT